MLPKNPKGLNGSIKLVEATDTRGSVSSMKTGDRTDGKGLRASALDENTNNATSNRCSTYNLHRIDSAKLLFRICSSTQGFGMVSTGDVPPDALHDDTSGGFCALEASWSH